MRRTRLTSSCLSTTPTRIREMKVLREKRGPTGDVLTLNAVHIPPGKHPSLDWFRVTFRVTLLHVSSIAYVGIEKFAVGGFLRDGSVRRFHRSWGGFWCANRFRTKGVRLPVSARIPASCAVALVRSAGVARISTVARLPDPDSLESDIVTVPNTDDWRRMLNFWNLPLQELQPRTGGSALLSRR